MKISRDITCTNPRTIARIAYLDWLSSPTTAKKIFPNRIKTKWYRIIESTFSKINMEGPQTKFCANHSCEVHIKAMKKGARAAVGRGIKNSSFETHLIKSAPI